MRDGVPELAAEPHGERQLARLEVEQAKVRVGMDARSIASGSRRATCLDLDAALGGPHEQDPPRGAIQDGGHVELLDDVGGRRDQHLADGHALDVHAEDGAGDPFGLIGRAGELDAARLAATADQHLRLDDHLASRRRGTARRPLRAPSGVWATAHSGTGRPWATSSDLASAS